MLNAAIITVGSELVEGLRVDTNTAEIARALTAHGFAVVEATSVGDDIRILADILRRSTDHYDLVVVTGGLGPTHDDVTREAAASALGLPLFRDGRIVDLLGPVAKRHTRPEASEQVFRQADVLSGATVIDPVTGTAPGLVIPTRRGSLVLLPGPPAEMRPMLSHVLEGIGETRPKPVELAIAGVTESDVQVRALRVLADHPGVRLTVLARPGDVRIILVAESTDEDGLRAASDAVANEFAERLYARDGSTLAEVVVSEARTKGMRLACAESCTGGLLSAALTSVPGASQTFVGCAVTYDNRAKSALLDVPEDLLRRFGAVSGEVALAMAAGSRRAFEADLTVAITGIAGPGGGTDEKPVGLVWFGVADGDDAFAEKRLYPDVGREGIRERAVTHALDLLRSRIRSRR